MQAVRRVTRLSRVPAPGYERSSDEELRKRFDIESIESRVRRRRLLMMRSLVLVPSSDLLFFSRALG